MIMFPNTTIEELTSNKVYQFAQTKSVYLALLEYYAALFDEPWAKENWASADPELRSGKLWWVINEAWEEFCKVNPNLPLAWLATAKRALQLDHMPSNFHPWALAILEKFDLPHYQAGYRLPPEEYQAIAHDLPLALQGLRSYPPEKFAPPIEEDNWGYSDL
jgi:hypothetical protein